MRRFTTPRASRKHAVADLLPEICILAIVALAILPGCTSRGRPRASVDPGLQPAAGEWIRREQSSYLLPRRPSVEATAAADAQVVSTPAVTRNGTAYLGVGPTLVATRSALFDWELAEDDRLIALDPRGGVKWLRHLGMPARRRSPVSRETAPGCSPAIGPDGTIYYGTRAGKLFALSPSGSTKWSTRSLGARITGPVIIDRAGKIVTVRVDTKSVWAFSATGRRLWVFAPGRLVSSWSFGGDGKCYISHSRGVRASLWAVSSKGTSRRLLLRHRTARSGGWATDFDGPTEVLASDDRLYAADKEGLHAFDIDGFSLWDFTRVGRVTLPVGVGGDTLYVAAKAVEPDRPRVDSESLIALRLDGVTRWAKRLVPIGRWPESSQLPAESFVLQPSTADRSGAVCVQGVVPIHHGDPLTMFAVFDRSGRLKWKRQIGFQTSLPAVLDSHRTLHFTASQGGEVTGTAYAIGDSDR